MSKIGANIFSPGDIEGIEATGSNFFIGVLDFLRTAEMSIFLADKAPRAFEARLSLARALTAYIKATEFPDPVDRTDFNYYTDSKLMSAVRKLRGELAAAAYRLLDELDRCIPEMNAIGQANLMVMRNPSNPIPLFFREALVGANFVEYLTRTLPGQPDYFADFQKPVLSYFCRPQSRAKHRI
ncbi:hypothetical protein INS49_014296 [Diaporthe citri]|uniref:uncharacterized protein n=1 Tax=Diaporthe citri TaxID=83186 RepID=UPI001C80AB97|nr:uncharacterized protein INS49_014296 [Diaporthe citri]KAG6358412.1 hypothetical protein INS49_014296 [Diaporthe citri]